MANNEKNEKKEIFESIAQRLAEAIYSIEEVIEEVKNILIELPCGEIKGLKEKIEEEIERLSTVMSNLFYTRHHLELMAKGEDHFPTL